MKRVIGQILPDITLSGLYDHMCRKNSTELWGQRSTSTFIIWMIIEP